MTRRQVLERLRSAPLKSGLLNCHHVGLHSVVLDERADGSLSRIFFTTNTSRMDRVCLPSGHLVIGAHNHDKPIRFTALYGKAWHLSLDTEAIRSDSPLWHRYPFASHLETGQFALGDPRAFRVTVRLSDLDGTYLSTKDIHTVVAPPCAAWHCDEGPREDVKKYIWSPRPDLKLDDTGLYQPMGEDLLESARQYVIDKIAESA